MSRAHDVCPTPVQSPPQLEGCARPPWAPNAQASSFPDAARSGSGAAQAVLGRDPLGAYYYDALVADPHTAAREALFTAYVHDHAGFEGLLCLARQAAQAEASQTVDPARAAQLRALPAGLEGGLAALRQEPTPFELDVLLGQLDPDKMAATADFVRLVFGAAAPALLERLSERAAEEQGEGLARLGELLGVEEAGALSGLLDFALDRLALNVGAGLQLASNSVGGLADPLLDGVESEAFNAGRDRGEALSLVIGAAETALGLTMLTTAMTMTGGGAAAIGASGGALAVPVGGLVVVVDGVAVVVGGALALHGGVMLKSGGKKGRNEGVKKPQGRRENAHQPVEAPDTLDAFPSARSARKKTPKQGGGGRRDRWTDPDGNIYEWDSQHGTIEKYNRRGKHLGEYSATPGPDGPVQLKPAKPGRRVEP